MTWTTTEGNECSPSDVGRSAEKSCWQKTKRKSMAVVLYAVVASGRHPDELSARTRHRVWRTRSLQSRCVARKRKTRFHAVPRSKLAVRQSPAPSETAPMQWPS